MKTKFCKNIFQISKLERLMALIKLWDGIEEPWNLSNLKF